ncbi:MAG TPA: thioredoxin [Thermoanaerobaculia bacterium]|nr:thioredoxin [Thermoanaerobaculia bacterium]
MASDKIVTITEDNFEQEVVHSAVPVLVDFWATWCGPCRMVAPTLDTLADELDGKVRVGKLNVDDNRNLAIKYQVQSIPTFILFKDGQAVERKLGVLPKTEFQNLVGRHVAIA